MQKDTIITTLSCQQFEFITESNIKINGLSNINRSLSIHYLIYRIDNIENGKYYIGQHETDNPLDSYMGSGNLIRRAIAKYGIEKFIKTILFDFDNFEQMNEKEKELVPFSACHLNNEMSYNLVEGGCGGNKIIWDDEQRNKVSIRFKGKQTSRKGTKLPDYWKEKIANGMTGKGRENNIKFQTEHPQKYKTFLKKLSKIHKGKKISNETKIKMSQSMSKIRQGKDNPAYGRKWMYKYFDKKLDRKYVQQNDVQHFLDLGYKFGKK